MEAMVAEVLNYLRREKRFTASFVQRAAAEEHPTIAFFL
jgi:hypothetical protein